MRNEPAVALPAAHMIGAVPVHPVRLDQLLAWIGRAMAARERAMVAYANVYAVNLAQDDPAFRAALAGADVVFCDGQGLRLGAALLGRPLPERFTPPDWVGRLAALCASGGHRVFLLGGRPGVAEAAAGRLRAAHPGLYVAAHHGYFHGSPADERAALEAVRAFQPDLLLVGMGMPLQERWVAERRAQIAAPVVMTVGALFDYLAGAVPRGPRWMTDNGLEWLCRLWYEPRRLWQRYLLGNPRFGLLVARQLLAERRGPPPGAPTTAAGPSRGRSRPG